MAAEEQKRLPQPLPPAFPFAVVFDLTIFAKNLKLAHRKGGTNLISPIDATQT